MTRVLCNPKVILTALFVGLATAAGAQGHRLDDLFAALGRAEGPDAEQIAQKIASEWSKSGSPSMDFLLTRGRDALEAGDTGAAIGHLTALVDHAPDFAEGYNARATAYFIAGAYGPAMDDIRMALSLNPRHFGAMTGLAVILAETGQPARSLEVWREVERLYPASPDAALAIPALAREIEGSTL